MIVVDASAVVEALVGRVLDEALLDALSGEVHAPHLLDVEVLSALRGLERGRKLAADIAERAWNEYADLDVHRHELAPLAERVWALRHSLTTYDATYLALAEALDAPLWTGDRALVDAPGTVSVRLVTARSS